MVSNEVWTGTGQSVTMAPESELFLGYMPFGPTLGKTGTNRSHLIKYSLGYGLDGSSVVIENYHFEPFEITVDDAAHDGSVSVTIDANSRVWEGAKITGTNITAGTTVANVNSDTEIELSQAPSSALTDGATLIVSNNAKLHFTDFYHLVPDLYTGCTAKFYTTTASGTAATLEFTARVAGNDADAIYFSGNLADFPSLFADQDAAVGTSLNNKTIKRGYIVLEANGAVIPAPISLENRATVSSYSSGDETLNFTASTGSVESIKVDDLIYNADGELLGKVWTAAADSTLTTVRADATASSTNLHFMSSDITTSNGASSGSNGILSLTVNASVTGIFTAGDYISFYASDDPASATILGRIITMNSTGLTLTIAQSGSAAITDADSIYWGRDITFNSSTLTIHTVYPRILSNHWLGLTNSITTPTTEVEMRQMNLSLGGTRNFSYQYRGMETAGQASLDVNLNHGAWLYYAFGTLSSLSATTSGSPQHYNNFTTVDSAPSNHTLYAGVNTDNDDRDASGHTTLNGKFHRVLKGSTTFCPPLLPYTSAKLVSDPSINPTSGALQNGITYTLSENNSAKLPSFAMELLVQKPSVLAGSSQSLMVDRNTYNESVYAQIYPGLVVSDMSLSANENEELKASINLNTKTVIEAPDGYVGKCYDATNNDTTEFKNLLNFGQQTGDNTECEQGFLDPFFFSNGSISLFGQEFLKVSTFSLNIQNGVQDKRYVGQYNNRIKDYITGQRTYEVTIQALVTDRRIYDELRKLSPNRVALSDALIDLEFTKSNGESITLSFDDYMISTATWPIQDDRGPIQVDFTIMPLRVNSVSTTTHWVMQS